VLIWRRPVCPHPTPTSAEPPHHCFSCCSYSSRTAGDILLIQPPPLPKKKSIRPILCWCTKSFPPLACLLSSSRNKLPICTSDYSHSLPACFPIINPPLRSPSIYPRLFFVTRRSLPLFRLQHLSSSVKLQSARRSAGYLQRLTVTYRTQADLQLIAMFHQACRNNPVARSLPRFSTSGCAVSIARCPCLLNKASVFLNIMNTRLHLCIPWMSFYPSPPPSPCLASLFFVLIAHHLRCQSLPTRLVDRTQETCAPRQMMEKDHGQVL